MGLERQPVGNRSVALVPLPTPLRLHGPEIGHDPVAMDLREDRRGSNAKILAIRLFRRKDPTSEIARIHVVGDHDRRRRNQGARRRPHGQTRRLEDIELVDELDPDLAHRPPCAARPYSGGRLFSPVLGQLLGVPNARVIRNQGIGGLIFTASPNEQMQELADYCRSFSTIPPAISLEGRWSSQYPDISSLAAISSDSLRYLAGAKLGEQFRENDVSLFLTKEMDAVIAYLQSLGHARSGR